MELVAAKVSDVKFDSGRTEEGDEIDVATRDEEVLTAPTAIVEDAEPNVIV